MAPSTLTYVTCDEGYSGIYVNNFMYYQGHSIPPFVWLEVINKYDIKTAQGHEITDEYMYEWDQYPMYLSEIPEEAFRG